MTRKVNFIVFFVLFTALLMLLTSNAHAFIATSQLNAITFEFVPENPNSSMSFRSIDYNGMQRVDAYQTNGKVQQKDVKENRDYDPSGITLSVATENAQVTADFGSQGVKSVSELGEDTTDYQYCTSNWNLYTSFQIQGDGWLRISAVQTADFESNSSFDVDYYSNAELILINDSKNDDHRNRRRLSEDSSELSQTLWVEAFFNDGDIGQFNTWHYHSLSNNGSNEVPIPCAAWLFACGLSYLVAFRRGSR